MPVPALALLLSLDPAPMPAAATHTGPDPTFLRAFAETRRFTLGYPTRITPSPDGKTVLFLRSPPRSPVLGLHELDLGSGRTRELVTPAEILKGAQEVLSVAEKARRERMRITTRGFTAFELSQDGRRILLPLSGRLYLYHRNTGKVQALTDGKVPTLDPRLSPDGEQVAFVKGHDVFAVDVATGRERRVTRGGTEEITHGLAEFAAQEEMARFEGYWWSPDGRLIAYEEADHRGLERFTIAEPARPEKAPDVFPYPRAGRANARVRLGITAARGAAGKTVWVKWDGERYPYLARVIWKEKKAPLTILVQTRDQREQALLAVDPATGRTRGLLVDNDDAWVYLDARLPRWLPDGSGFLHTSERSGQRQLELRKPGGELDRVLVADSFLSLVHVAEDSRSAAALTATPVTTTLVRVALHGADGGQPVALTREPAEHEAVFSKNGDVYVLTRTTAAALPESAAFRADGTRVATLGSVAEPPPFQPRVELTTVKGDSGRTYHAAITRPRAFVPSRKYPVVVNVYGGPGSLTVKSDQRAYLLAQWIADHGAIVISVDNRGTPRRGREWSRAIKGSFAAVPIEDQVDGLRALGSRFREMDLARVGIYGWSFGGYVSALAVLRRPDVFKVAVAGAPVVDWTDYDTHYTERYLDLPARNPQGYEESSLLTHAARLTRPLLIVHGTADDNVYFFHTLKLSDALFKAGRHHELLPLAGFTHQVPDPVVIERLYERIAGFLMRGLS